MASIVISGNTSGSITLDAPAVSGTTTLTLPTANGTLVTTASGQTLTSPTIATPTITGQATIPTINLTGGQITFPATQSASANANTLDDYEEGTWTPTLTGSGGGAAAYFEQSGTYTKIGNMVTLNMWIYASGKSTISGDLTMTLPFTTGGTATRPSAIMKSGNISITGLMGGWVNSSSAQYNLQSCNNGGQTTLNASSLPAGVFEIYMNLSYSIA
jgi:hypothetical protein